MPTDRFETKPSSPGLKNHPLLQQQWYHRIELEPGLFTDALAFENVYLTRELLRHAVIEGTSCLDVGAMDCLVTLLMLRRGAASVVSYDKRTDTRPRVDLLKEVFNLKFDHIAGVPLSDLRAATKSLGHYPFDVVIFSGVLYHLFDPLAGLAYARGLLRDGGLLIVETAAVGEDQMAMFFNANSRYYPGADYWFVSIECLDYLLRFIGLSPIDCVYFKERKDKITGQQMYRVAVACRAESHWPTGNDTMIGKQRHNFSDFLDWDELACPSKPPVAYTSPRPGLITSQNTGTIDLAKTVRATRETRVDDPPEQVWLKLDAMY